jgi:hypothetical protein
MAITEVTSERLETLRKAVLAKLPGARTLNDGLIRALQPEIDSLQAEVGRLSK